MERKKNKKERKREEEGKVERRKGRKKEMKEKAIIVFVFYISIFRPLRQQCIIKN